MTRPLIAPPSFLVDSEETQYDARSAVAAERARIMRELDDSVSKSLLGVSMIAESLVSHRDSADPAELDRRLRELARLASDAVSDARAVINGLHDDAFGDVVRGVVTEWSNLTGISANLELGHGIVAPPEIRREIVLILREALTNTERHARASRAHVCLRIVEDRLLLTVADDGSGFCVPADLTELRATGRAGLIRMDQRVRQLGGTLIMTSWPGLGTHIEVDLPAPALTGQWLRAAPQAPPVRVIIADENPVLRRGLRACVERSPRIEIAAEAETGQRAMSLVRTHCPDVLLLDVRMLPAAEMSIIPRLSEQTRVVMLASPDDGDLVIRALEAGACGYVIHGEFRREDLIQIVLDAGRRTPAPPGMPSGGRARAGGLRPREREVMGLIAEGLTNRQIAARLVISEKTVKNHICSIYQYFGVHERSQAVNRWLELLRSSAPAPGPLLGVEHGGIWPVEAGSPRDGNGRDRGMDVQLAQHVLDMGAHSIS